ncbi:Tetratricopeptide repeat protein 39B [Oryzias melastigma]|uniref:Tetratricopeptide repeat protein 39B n=1 Tax=Oryzias melastigma TaxID=30732 RepID=A0A834FFR2_ORYME|nr:Tetratricopeptide repeat protein 39B [Oryzias melastigma]
METKEDSLQQVDVYEDELAAKIDLETALEECTVSLYHFLNNRFADSLAALKPRKNTSMYHAVGYSSILLMQAAMTFDPKDMDAAMTSLKDALHVCQRFRKKTGLMESLANFWYGQQNETLTEEEMHAEICCAEVLMQKAALTFLDESIIGFIKGGMGMRNSYQIYKYCQDMENVLTDEEKQKRTHVHFRGGVSMGIGSFNLMLSLFPARVLRLMEFLGFSGNRELGLAELRAGASSNNLRSILSTMTMLMFHLYITVILAQEEWRQIHHLCYWELMWTYSFEQNWIEAYRYANLLSKENKWSQAIYVYHKAAILSMLPPEEVSKLGENVVALFRQVEGLRLRIAGKSIPTEKFAAKKAERYSSPSPVKLVVPALEMMYVWNGFTVVGKRPDLTENILCTLERAEKELKTDLAPSEYHLDDQCVIQLLKGLCLRELGLLDRAEACFNHVISSENDIKHDNYLVPFTTYELGLLHKQKGDVNKAITVIESVKTNYKNYSMESRLHFRIHAALNTMGSFEAKLPPSRTPA